MLRTSLLVIAIIIALLLVYGVFFIRNAKKRREFLGQLGVQVFLLFITAIVMFPVFWILTMSLEPAGFSKPLDLKLIPTNISFDAYRKILVEPWIRFCSNPAKPETCMTFGGLLLNSLFVSLGTSIFAVIIGSSAAYAFSRFKFIGRQAGMLSFIILLMLPAVATVGPLFVLFNSVPIGDETLRKTLMGLAIAYASSVLPFAVWNLKGYFDTIPKELEEAALIDGASPTQSFIRVILPLSLPAMAVTVLFGFMTGWTEFALAWLFLESPQRYTLAMALTSMIGERTIPWNEFAAMSIVMSLPVVFFFFLMQRWIISGLTIGGVKG